MTNSSPLAPLPPPSNRDGPDLFDPLESWWSLRCGDLKFQKRKTILILLFIFFHWITPNLISNMIINWQKLESSTTSKTDCYLLRQKVCQKISVIITNTCVFSVFKTKRVLKCKIFLNIIRSVCFDYWDFLKNFLT